MFAIGSPLFCARHGERHSLAKLCRGTYGSKESAYRPAAGLERERKKDRFFVASADYGRGLQ